MDKSFGFVDSQLQGKLLALVEQVPVVVGVVESGRVWYNSQHEEQFEDLLTAVRNSVFATWQIVSCSADWVERYRHEMRRQHVEYYEEVNDGQTEFLIAQQHNHHLWGFVENGELGSALAS